MLDQIQFWLVIAVILAAIIFLLSFTITRAHGFLVSRNAAVDALHALQIDELEEQYQHGVIENDQLEAMRSELNRAHRRAKNKFDIADTREGPKLVGWLVIATTLAMSLGTYYYVGVPYYPDMGLHIRAEWERPNQDTMIEILVANNAVRAPAELDEDTKVLYDKLLFAIKQNPEDADGYKHLSNIEFRRGDFVAAYQAQEKYNQLTQTPLSADEHTRFAETMIMAANGYVSPESENAIREALRIDPNHKVAIFYMALTMKQEGKLEDARTTLEGLQNSEIQDPVWSNQIDQQIKEIEQKLSRTNGPSPEQIAAAESMTEQERAEFIGTMVEGLQTRLATEGGKAEDWARLVRSLRVLGREEEANAISNEAQQIFPNNPAFESFFE